MSNKYLLFPCKPISYAYTLFQNGSNFTIILLSCKLALVASCKGNIRLNFKFKNEATRANLQENKRILKWRPFWNKVYGCFLSRNNYVGPLSQPIRLHNKVVFFDTILFLLIM